MSLRVQFTDASYDPDGVVASRHWDFGDGTTSTEANPLHAFPAAGTYAVKLTVTDDKGATGTKTSYVTVEDIAVAPFFVEDFSRYVDTADLTKLKSVDATRHWTMLSQNAPATEITLDTSEGVPALGLTRCMRHQFRGNGAHEQACGMDMVFPGDHLLNKEIWVEIWIKFDANYLTNSLWQFHTTSDCTNLQIGEIAEGTAQEDGGFYGGRVVDKVKNADGTWTVYWHMNIGYGIAKFNFEDLTLTPARQGDVLTGKTSGVSFKYTKKGFHYWGNPDHKTWFFDVTDKGRWGETHIGHSGDGFAVYVNVAPIDWVFYNADALFDGKWHRVRWHYKLSSVAVSPGVASGYDGIERLWLDDELKVERLGWATPHIGGFSGMAIGRNHNMGFHPGYNTGYKTGSIRAWRQDPGWYKTPLQRLYTPPAVGSPKIVRDFRAGGNRDIQKATTWQEAYAQFDFVGDWWDLCVDMDGAGKNAMVAKWNKRLTQGDEARDIHITGFNHRELFIQFKMRAGRTPSDPIAHGVLQSFDATNPNVAGAGQKLMRMTGPDWGTDIWRATALFKGGEPGTFDWWSESTPSYGANHSQATDAEYQNVEWTIIYRLKCESAQGAGDGAVGLRVLRDGVDWKQGPKEMTGANVGGPSIGGFGFPTVMNTPIQDQSQYFYDIVIWTP